MNFRPSAQLREMHDDNRCPDNCGICAQIEDTEAALPKLGRDYLITQDYEEAR